MLQKTGRPLTQAVLTKLLQTEIESWTPKQIILGIKSLLSQNHNFYKKINLADPYRMARANYFRLEGAFVDGLLVGT
jgi:hypothetical protein